MSDDRSRKVISNIKENYKRLESSIVEQLYMVQKIHGPTIGSAREDIWKELFEMLIPQKFVIEHSVFIIDSEGHISKEVDLAIMDQTYTPYIFKFGRVKFIPIEAVAVVIECKSHSLDELAIREWSEAIKCLKTSVNSITRIAPNMLINSPNPTQKSTRPIRILCALKEKISDDIKMDFDFILTANDTKEHKYISIEENKKRKTLYDWHKTLNFYRLPDEKDEKGERENGVLLSDIEKMNNYTLEDYVVYDKETENTLLSFNFQLNQILMLINNPILFPHLSYVKLFNQSEENQKEDATLEEKEEEVKLDNSVKNK